MEGDEGEADGAGADDGDFVRGRHGWFLCSSCWWDYVFIAVLSSWSR
jgi:hypothetical protein